MTRAGARSTPTAIVSGAIAMVVLACGSGGPRSPVATSSASAIASSLPPDPCATARSERARVPALLAEGKLDRARRVIHRANARCDEEKQDTWSAEVSTLAELGAWSDVRPLADAILADPSASAEAKTAATDALTRARELDVTFEVTDEAKKPMRAKYREAQERGAAGDAAAARDLYVDAWKLWRPNGQALVQADLEARKLGQHVDAQRLFDRGLEELVRATGSTVRVDVPNGLFSNFLDWSPRGRIALSDGAGITLVAQHSLAEVLRLDGMVGGLFSPDGTLVLGRRRDGPLTAWDASTGEELRAFPDTAGDLEGFDVSADGKRLVVSNGPTVRVFDVASGSVVRVLTVAYDRASVHLTGDGSTVMTATIDRTQFWSCDTGKELRSLDTTGYTDPELSPDGALFAAVAHDGAAVLLDAKTGRKLRKLDDHASRSQEKHNVHITGFEFSRNGAVVRSMAWDDDDIVVWDVSTGHIRSAFRREDDAPAAHLSSDGALLAIGGRGLRVYDTSNGKELRRSAIHAGSVNDVALSPDGKRLVVAAKAPLRLWDLERGVVRAAPAVRDVEAVTFLHRTQGSDEILGAMHDGGFEVWGTTLDRIRTIPGSSRSLYSPRQFALAPDDGLIAAALDELAPALFVARASAAAPALELPTEQAPCGAVTFAASGALVGACGDRLRWWDLATGKLLHEVPATERVDDLAVSPDGRVLATMHEDGVRLFDGPSLETPPKLFPGPKDATQFDAAITISPDGTLLAAAAGDELRIWDLPAGTERHKGRGNRFGSRALAFSADARLLAAGGADGTTLLFRAPTYEAFATLRGMTDADASYVLSSDGFLEILGSEPDKVRALALCRIGGVTFELAVCAERLETHGLLAKLMVGDESYQAP